MKEELNNDLKKRISEVFDNYEDPGADAGWMLLRERFPAQAHNRGVMKLWWISAAAVILLCLGLGLWIRFDKNDQDNQVAAVKPVKKTQQQVIKKTVEARATEKQNNEPFDNGAVGEQIADNQASGRFKPVEPTLDGAAGYQPTEQAVTAARRGAAENYSVATSRIASTVNRGKKDSVISTPRPQAANQQYVAAVTVPAEKPDNTAAAIQPDVKQPAVATKPSMDDMFARDYAKNAAKKQERKGDKLINFGVYAATYVNYAKGSDNRVNVGAGVSSDFRLSKNLKLSTGVSIAQNSFNYNVDNTTQLSAVAFDASAVGNSIKATDEKGFNTSIAAPELQNYNASLMGLDIPVNLKYEFNPDKSDTYISAGLSSGTFLNQNYNYRYNYSSISGRDSRVVNEKIEQGVGNFYFAKTLNVAFGIGYPLGKSNRLVIEPFVKYPLDGLGAQQIKFGAGGINLKLNFQTGKK
ncbi:outer membrane beta-barrel protein [Mucilaginibacter sp. UR6-1]|uniref:outer membrane beta-barrel protein n=1 Tax=Mucilaginibacter sp. UR6-1 TaxID=1435643 RepID=UPI001E3F2E57|nr:outer membrane beta-barrel protein [Mucilaginibacter sp. UR6-1]MCC8409944.1 outer membrane beta-barrel protein [Mucilaginibacter sp. UR6-1]